MGGSQHQHADFARARTADSRAVWIAAIAIPLMLLAPALWNGYPLLQWDTGGYLARWYEGYLVPSRSTVFGLYLHFGEDSGFWINLGIQALATLWILQLTLRVFGMAQPLRLLAISLVLVLTTALPWLASMLLTDIFAGLSVLSLFILVAHGEQDFDHRKMPAVRLHRLRRRDPQRHAGGAARTVLRRLDRAAVSARADCRFRTDAGQPHHRRRRRACCCRPISRCRDNWPGRPAVTASPSDGCCRMASSRSICAIIVRKQKLKLCPYRDQLPATADQFLWGNSMFNTLGRFQGLNDEMGFIVLHSLAEYPAWQAEAALTATAQQLVHVAHRRRHQWLDRPYLRHHRALSPGAAEADARGASAALAISISPPSTGSTFPVALASMLLAAILFGHGAAAPAVRRSHLARRRRSRLPLLGNAFICAVISGPHDRYGARMAWIATLVVLIAAVTAFRRRRRRATTHCRRDRKSSDAGLVDLVADRAHVVAVRNVEHFRRPE